MTVLRILECYRDDHGNEIVYTGAPLAENVRISFSGHNNRVLIAEDAKIVSLALEFAGNGGVLTILPTSQRRTGLRLSLRVGHRSRIMIGENCGTTRRAFISAVEGASVSIGADCMLAAGIEIRTDDAHPIYDVRTGRRLNSSESIEIGDHVWIAKHATIMGGVTIGSGAVIGLGSIVTRSVPNNSIAVGAPARVVRRDIAWERPMLRSRPPGQSGPGLHEKNEQFWQLTRDMLPTVVPVTQSRRQRLARFVPGALQPMARQGLHRAQAIKDRMRRMTASRVGRR